jgi:hypothetical protein
MAKMLLAVKEALQSYCDKANSPSSINQMWKTLKTFWKSSILIFLKKNSSIQTFDFSTLYTIIQILNFIIIKCSGFDAIIKCSGFDAINFRCCIHVHFVHIVKRLDFALCLWCSLWPWF